MRKPFVKTCVSKPPKHNFFFALETPAFLSHGKLLHLSKATLFYYWMKFHQSKHTLSDKDFAEKNCRRFGLVPKILVAEKFCSQVDLAYLSIP